jgi:uncharacterized protein (DUF2147 family)
MAQLTWFMKGVLWVISLLILALFSNPGLAQTQPLRTEKPGDAILGQWVSENGDARVNIYRATNGQYFGQIVWLETPNDPNGKPRVDAKNPDPKLRNQPIVGTKILRGFVYDADDKEWDDGRAYDPESGNVYRCYMELESSTRLRLRGYIGVSLIGRTTYWTRQ